MKNNYCTYLVIAAKVNKVAANLQTATVGSGSSVPEAQGFLVVKLGKATFGILDEISKKINVK